MATSAGTLSSPIGTGYWSSIGDGAAYDLPNWCPFFSTLLHRAPMLARELSFPPGVRVLVDDHTLVNCLPVLLELL